MYQTHQRGSGLSATISEYMIRLKSQSSTKCNFSKKTAQKLHELITDVVLGTSQSFKAFSKQRP